MDNAIAEVVPSAENSKNTGGDEGVDRLTYELSKLYHFLEHLMSDLHQSRNQTNGAGCVCEPELLAQIDSISSRMHEIAWALSETTVSTLRAAHAKSMVLKDWCDERADVKDALASSLCDDLDAIVKCTPAIGVDDRLPV